MTGPIRTPSSVAFELMYATTRDLTPREQAYVYAYHRITTRTENAKHAAFDMFGRTSKAAAAAIYLAESEEKIDLKRALITFDDVDDLIEPDRRLALL